MKHRIHAAAAMLTLLFLAAFWMSTVVSELFLSASAVAQVKIAIAYALWGFLPVMMLTAASGFLMGGKGRHPLLLAKRRRMPFIAINGLLILVPAAVFLSLRAQAGLLDRAFYGVQALELAAGAANLALIGLNIRDGLRLGRLRRGAQEQGRS
ncbi:hypothetical protein [Achromobacter denitrificans]|uniref:Transmembrane protein n=1 Tax=Achromobacter denitrificans TaxID=32002 RepID=A0ABZ3GA96_ACHDE|nr:hypothetical protein [Achromobacter denitrificans]ASC68407.1 hypothetical protein B9P52_30870 [Achromobacter denitrificans]MDF3846851.1 hypothetical protein [Achromobacter denitrificans]MDF3939196.1 hypothetical protein [Achromobacter denitrificans]RSE82649.1 hypothetical protein EGU64_17360 [Achromobacter denitrificans]CAB3910261.1 hypothetical protein LMG1860_05814 [Achromobacter denitrificans]